MKTFTGKARISRSAKEVLARPQGAEKLVSAVLESKSRGVVSLKLDDDKVVKVSSKAVASRSATG